MVSNDEGIVQGNTVLIEDEGIRAQHSLGKRRDNLGKMKNEEAYLSNAGNYTVFKYANHVIRFLAPYSLERYTKVKEWDNGYLVVEAKYGHHDKEEEEYIDLVPILNNLYFDAAEFLKPIKKVRVLYD